MNPNLKIQEFIVGQYGVSIAVKLKCDLDIRVRSPKVTVMFSDGVSDRRLPMIVESVQATRDLKHCIIYAKYTYFINLLFIPYDPNATISVSVSLSYGDNYYEKIPFVLSRDIDFENEFFQIEVDPGMTEISLKNKEVQNNQYFGLPFLRACKTIISTLYRLVLLLVSIALIPLFLLDAVVSKLGISRVSKQNKSTGIKWFLSHVRWRMASFIKADISIKEMKNWYLKAMYRCYSRRKIVRNRVTFLSSRRDDMTGNLAFIYDRIKDNANLDIQVLLDPSVFSKMSFKNIRRLSYLCATSRVLLIDDFFPTLNRYELRKDTKLIQLWHACGAFKTFGFSRLGKKGGPTQNSKNHRNYDYAIVSSNEIAKYYAEGFGIPIERVKATGVPRTDIFFDQAYKNRVVNEFYEKYPKLKDKKIILFAPTFRGNGKESAYYPQNRFDPARIYEETNGEYAILIKHHPFVQDEIEIDPQYKDYIINMSDQSEINDLLFVTDVLITDYSSVVFEASLLDIPMLFYAYDLNRYIATRDFYCEYELFVPGKIVQSQSSLISAIEKQDFEAEKIDSFKKQFFDYLDGHSTERVVELIMDIVKEGI
ncbi:putative polyribitolphosphotransferase [Lachnospiraceae bacterium KM106-2]|nr:putative polyribitolphosphotransferase [Lachnospiraceae bacterium KM106-2]